MKEQKDLFQEKHIEPMLIRDQKEAFNDPDFIFELKLDGLRCIAYLDPQQGTDLRNKRNKALVSLYPELIDIHTCVTKKCIMDGELVLFKDGAPDFHSMQKRSVMKDLFKIRIAARQAPVSFVAFDILAVGDEVVMQLPLMKRKELLQQYVVDGERMQISRYIEELGIPFYEH